MALYQYHKQSHFSVDESRINLQELATEIQKVIKKGLINTVYDSISSSDGYVNINFRSPLDGYELSYLNSVVLNHSGNGISPFQQISLNEARDEDNRLIVVVDPRSGSEVVLATHNFCDPCTWYAESVRQSENLTMRDVDGYVFGGTRKNWIDISNGRILREEHITDTVVHGYKVKIRVNNKTLVEKTLLLADPSSADYVVNYEDGYITFLKKSYLGDVVSAEYSYATGSSWFLIPFDNKKIRIERAEAQFSEDVGFRDIIEMIFYIGNPKGNPNSWQEYKKVMYKNLDNFIDEAEGAFPHIPPLPGVGGTKKTRYGFPFRYSTSRSISSGIGMFLVVRLLNNRKLDGERATATFYCTIANE